MHLKDENPTVMKRVAFETPSEMEARVGESIRKLRLHRNIDQATLAERAGISRSALRNLESGKGSTLHTLMSILRVLGRESWLDTLAPIPSIDPMTMPRRASIRQRASSPRRPQRPLVANE
jgi:transcriptional regulator with XRE-family HTH domain